MVGRKGEDEKYGRWKQQHVQMHGEETVPEPLRKLKGVGYQEMTRCCDAGEVRKEQLMKVSVSFVKGFGLYLNTNPVGVGSPLPQKFKLRSCYIRSSYFV